ncbi:hypothetical protein N9V35_00705 [bacterium]|nr:hypothetical protein [bacterium]
MSQNYKNAFFKRLLKIKCDDFKQVMIALADSARHKVSHGSHKTKLYTNEIDDRYDLVDIEKIKKTEGLE